LVILHFNINIDINFIHVFNNKFRFSNFTF